jgi:dihydroneopterin aldolase
MTTNYHIERSTIELCGITFHSHHGVLPEERLLGNTFVVDLTLESDISQAAMTDNLTHTINYAEAYEVVRKEMEAPSQLLEHVCGRIATALLQQFSTLERVHVRLAKKNPPIEGIQCTESAVSLTLTR